VESLEDRTAPSATPLSVAQQIITSTENETNFVTQQYQTFLHRAPDQTGLNGWVNALQNGLAPEQMQASLASSAEALAASGGANASWVTSLYQSFLGRTPSQTEITPWLNGLTAGLSPLQVAQGFATSLESEANAITADYQQLLGRAPQSSEITLWQNALQQGLNLATLEEQIIGSPEFLTHSGGTDQNFIGAIYQDILGRTAGQSEITAWLNALTGTNGSTSPSAQTNSSNLITLTLPPLNINLLGLHVQTTDTITVTVSAQPGNGELLGNLLTDVSGLLNLQGVNNALNNVLASVVNLVNSTSLNVSGLDNSTGPLVSTTNTATTPVLDLYVAPVHLNLLGALVDTSPIHLTITATPGQGQILGNVLTDLANLFNPPLPSQLTLDDINTRLQGLIQELSQQLPNITPATTTTPTTTTGSEQVLALTVPPINLNLLGLNLKTSQIQVNANANTGNGNLLGNVLTTLLNTLGATPQNLTTLNNNLNTILADVIGVLNASSLTLPSTAINSLSQVLQTLALPNLVNTSGTPASAPILNLSIASTDGTTPPVNVNLLGLQITTSNIQAQLLAQTGDGQILGNLLYNVANLLNPGGSLNLLSILNQLGL
jgi:hypothetical protein